MAATAFRSLSNVVVADSGFFYSIGATANNVTSTNGETYLGSVRLGRKLTTTGEVLTDVYNRTCRVEQPRPRRSHRTVRPARPQRAARPRVPVRSAVARPTCAAR